MKIEEIRKVKDELLPSLEAVNQDLSRVINNIARLKSRMYIQEDWHGESAMLTIRFDNSLFPPDREVPDLHRKMFNSYLETHFKLEQLENIQEDLQSFIIGITGTKMCEVDILTGAKIKVKNCED